MLNSIKAFVLFLALTLGAGLAWIYSGLYDVSATAEDSVVSHWLLGTVRRHSIQSRLAGITVPPLTDPTLVEEGFDHYHAMCEECHLGPGLPASELHQGLNPQPPLLSEVVPHSSPAQLFWTIKNGIRMTGMPAWGTTHDDAKIWAMVAFLEQLPKMTPEQYQAMVKQAKPDDDMHMPTGSAKH